MADAIRLFDGELEATLYRVVGDEPTDLAIAEEQTVQLLAAVAGLLRQHYVNKRGQCNFCGWTRWWLRGCRRRPQCTVFRNLSFAMGQPLDVVLWHVFAIFDNNTTLEEVREWIEQRHYSRARGAGASPCPRRTQ